MPAALYARYSTDNQRQTSIEDQLRMVRARAVSELLEVDEACVYSDGATSASMPVEQRPGSRQLMLDAMAGRFDVLVLEALDRFSRDLVDQERMVRRLEYRGVRIVGIADGYDSDREGREFLRQVKGSFNEQLLRDISKKTHRGLTGQFERGYTTGGLSYGYRSTVAGVDSRGEAIGHLLEVDEAQAEWVRWIFARYADGWSCQRIAAELNRHGVPSPRGSTWATSALYGSPAKGSGILNNEIYVGRYTWNRSRWIKEPDTKRRKRFDRPRDEWMVEERPQLRIVADEAWQAVRARMAKPRAIGGTKGKGAKVRSLFGGLLKCGTCGGAVTAVNVGIYGCVARKDRGTTVCAGVSVNRKKLEARMLAMVREELLAPARLAELQDQVRQIAAARLREQARAGDGAQRRLGELEREIGNLVQGIASVGVSEALSARLRAAEAEKARLQPIGVPRQLGGPSEAVPAVLARYKAKLMGLLGAMETDVDKARTGLAELLGEIVITREPGGTYAELDASPERILLAAGGSLGVVAGARFGSRKRIRIN